MRRSGFFSGIYIYMIFFLYLIPFFVELELDGTCLHQCVDQLICGVTAILVGGSELHPINRQTNRGLSEHTLADLLIALMVVSILCFGEVHTWHCVAFIQRCSFACGRS
jgi:hypothetical protein